MEAEVADSSRRRADLHGRGGLGHCSGCSVFEVRGGNVTRAFELQQWLRQNGPATMAEIKDAGFTNFSGLTRDRMLEYGAIETYTGPNPHSERAYARFVTTLYIATDKDYRPHRGAKPGARPSAEIREASVVARAISTLTRRGYQVIPPVTQHKQGKTNGI